MSQIETVHSVRRAELKVTNPEGEEIARIKGYLLFLYTFYALLNKFRVSARKKD